MKIYENKILRILGFIFIWIYVFGVGICFAKWYAIGISGAILLVVWLNSGLIGDTIYKYRVKQATKQIKRHGIQLFVDLNQCKSHYTEMEYQKSRMQEPIFGYSIHGKSNFGMVSVAIYSLTFIIVNKLCPLQYAP